MQTPKDIDTPRTLPLSPFLGQQHKAPEPEYQQLQPDGDQHPHQGQQGHAPGRRAKAETALPDVQHQHVVHRHVIRERLLQRDDPLPAAGDQNELRVQEVIRVAVPVLRGVDVLPVDPVLLLPAPGLFLHLDRDHSAVAQMQPHGKLEVSGTVQGDDRHHRRMIAAGAHCILGVDGRCQTQHDQDRAEQTEEFFLQP